MNNFLSALLGLSFIVCFFLISFFSVVIVKIVILYFKPSKPEVKPVKKTPPKKVKPALKSIEINTDDIDKIYFKKSS
ncbi:MAG: hypothetical protein IJR66_04630 [Clostridia bacterium]|nr:hypothetical protein [Clostridia bacterium]